MLVNLLTYCLFHWLGFQLPMLLARPFMVAMLIIIVILIVMSHRRFVGHYRLMPLVFALSGILVSQTFGHSYFGEWRPKLGKHNYIVKGTVAKNVSKPYGQVIDLKLKHVDGHHINRLWVNQYIRLTIATKHLDQLPTLKRNDELEVIATLRQITGYENEFGFNYPQWLFSKKIIAVGNVSLRNNSGFVYRKSKGAITQQLVTRIKEQVNELTYGRFVLALLFADKSHFKAQDHDTLRNWGLSHLFAISGLHVGILVGLLIILMRVVGRYVPFLSSLFFCHSFSLLCVWFYLSVLGYPVSATRAALLLSVGLFLLHLGQSITAFTIISIVMVLSLVLDPTNILNMSWWLSISAVYSLFVLFRLRCVSQSDGHKEALKSASKSTNFMSKMMTLFMILRVYCWQLIKLQWLLTFAMMPVVIYWMQGLAVAGIVNNLIAIPVFSLILVPLIFVATFTYLVNEAGGRFLYECSNFIFEFLWRGLTALPLNDIWLTVPAHYCWYLILFYLALFYFNGVVTWPSRRISSHTRRLGLNFAIMFSQFLVLFVLYRGIKGVKPDIQFRIFDVGQGTSVFIESYSNYVLYDLGPIYASGASATEHVIKPYLDNTHINTLDLLIISHADSDHRGNINAIKSVDIQRLVNTCQDSSVIPRTFTMGNIQVELIWPVHHIVNDLQRSKTKIQNGLKNDNAHRRVFSQNAMSCVVRISSLSTGHSILLTGDIDLHVESLLAEQHLSGRVSLNSDVLVSSHHGSKFGSSSLFMRLVSPELVVHSAGVNNRFNFPSTAVVERAKALKLKQISTSQTGEIHIAFRSNGKAFKLNFELDFWTPFWKRQNPFSIQHQIR